MQPGQDPSELPPPVDPYHTSEYPVYPPAADLPPYPEPETPSYPPGAYPGASYPTSAYPPPAPGYQAPSYQAPAQQTPTQQAPSYQAASYQAPSYQVPGHPAAPGYPTPGYQAQGYPPPHAYGVPVQQAGQSNTFGLLSMIMGIVSLPGLCCFLGYVVGPPLGVAAVVLGIIGVVRARQGRADNIGMSITGIVTGGLGVLLIVLLLILHGLGVY